MSSEQDKETTRRLAIRAQIDENLKRVYARTASEELPDRFKDLLAQLKAKDSSGEPGKGGGS
ncbi:NepR family anti-sigma factor [Xinfangfangia sp. CPCC 101601]|uniref:NepR family anti-sigma factor n=1 Tax=Pseudogemmobacter lacusdianii TaxID=3069608 RepID=A0ABU0W1B9_9RHOB|nr:NepR family anti-sigma factor [Xinfangfangia sp. CPCC 101601]MDQ2067816.1 NepR family anti-sigma factor [Xinfangfangia sp. CPCC 101601]